MKHVQLEAAVRSDFAYWMAALLLLGSYVAHVSTLGLHFPVPWPDESSFLWPALAFARTGSLLAPELNPERDLFWMPPGYMLLQGTIFDWTGFSLAWARGLSTLYVSAAFACIAALLSRLPMRMLHLVALAVLLHSPIILLIGNTARMEALVLCMVLAALLLFARRREGPAIAVLSLTPLVHPNGSYFALAGGVWLLHSIVYPRAERPLRARSVAWLAVPLAAWSAYALYVSRHWADFRSDMAFQFGWKSKLVPLNGGFSGIMSEPEFMILALSTLVAAVYAWRRREPWGALFAFLGPALILYATAVGWLYESYAALAFAFTAVVWIEILWAWLASAWRPGWARGAAVVAASALLALANHWVFTQRSSFTESADASHVAIDAGDALPYMTPEDHQAIAAYVRALPAGDRPLTIKFLPWADALLFHDLESDRLRFLQPTFYREAADVYIVHRSQRIPAPAQTYAELFIMFDDIRTPIDQWSVMRQRSDGDRWFVYHRDAPKFPES